MVLMSFTCVHAFIYKRLKISIPNASKKHLLLKRNSKDTYTLTSFAHIDWVLVTSGKHKKESLTTFIASLMLTVLKTGGKNLIYSVKFLVFALSSYIFQGIFIYMMYPPKAEERWGFPENTKVKKVLWHIQVTQEAEDNCFIIHLGSSNTCLLCLVLYHIHLAGSLSTLLALGVGG